MALCALCQGLTIERLRQNEVRHHSDLISLRDSAEERGCRLCQLFWKALRDQVLSRDIERHLRKDFLADEGITDSSMEYVRLVGYIQDTKGLSLASRERNSPSSIHICSGPMAEVGKPHSKVYGHVDLYARPGRSPLQDFITFVAFGKLINRRRSSSVPPREGVLGALEQGLANKLDSVEAGGLYRTASTLRRLSPQSNANPGPGRGVRAHPSVRD
jgi:hypothetical protein